MKKSLYLLSTMLFGLLLNLQFARAQVVPEVTVIQPSEAGIEWVIGNTYLISWTDNFTLPVDIYLVDDDFATTGNANETLIGDDVEGSTFAWTISGSLDPSDECKIRVESSVNGAYNDDSEFYFSLVDFPSGNLIHVEQPNTTGISWVIGETYLVSWTIDFPGNVNIYLTNAAGTTDLETIATNVESSTYLWNTATHFSQGVGTYKIRIASYNDPTKDDVSDNTFNMVTSLPGTIELLQPTANNIQILVGSTYLISWIDTFTENVKIELTPDDGVNWYVIAASVEGSTYLWNTATLPVGNLISNGGTYKIKVSSVSAGTNDISEFGFAAVSTTGTEVTVLQPSEAGIEWLLGGQYLISWIDDMSGNVNIELWDEFGAGGAKVDDIATDVPGSTYIWNTAVNPVALDPGDYTIRVSNAAGTIEDFSNFAFAIVATSGTIEVLQPSIAGINWVVGTTHLISWIDNVPGPVDIQLESPSAWTLATDNASLYGGTWSDGDDHGSGFEPWDLRETDHSGLATLEFFAGDPATGGIVGMDDPSFGMIARTDPTDLLDEVVAYREFTTPMKLESTFAFDWAVNDNSGEKGFILYAGGEAGDELLHVEIANSDEITITHNATTTTMFNNAGVNVMSFNFEYLITGDLRVQANGRDGLETYAHTFEINAAPDAIKFFARGQFDDLDYLERASYFNKLRIFTYISDIAEDVEGTTFAWNTTGFSAGSYKIRVKNGDIEDLSDNNFDLVLTAGGTVEVLQPVGGETWVRGNAYYISWIDDLVEPVDVYLKNDDLAYSLKIKDDFEGSTFAYTLPGTLTPDDAYYVRVESSLNASYGDESGDFEIVSALPGTIEVIQPNGGEFIETNSAYLISWIDDIAEDLKIEVWQYDDAGGTNPQLRYTYNNVPSSTMVWNVPATFTGSFFKVKISSSDGSSTTTPDYSNATFTIANPVAVSVFPNPARDYVSINFDENISGSFDAVLYDRFNNQMMNFTVNAATKSHRISTAHLPEGVYFLRMTSGTNTIAQKIIVQH